MLRLIYQSVMAKINGPIGTALMIQQSTMAVILKHCLIINVFSGNDDLMVLNFDQKGLVLLSIFFLSSKSTFKCL